MTDQNMMELLVALKTMEDDKGTPLLSPDLLHLVENGLHHQHLPDALHPAAAEAFQRAFELIGGLPRLAIWADRYPAAFYKLFARMVIPTVAPVLPKAEATTQQEWPEWLTHRRLAYQEEQRLATDVDPKDIDDAGL